MGFLERVVISGAARSASRLLFRLDVGQQSIVSSPLSSGQKKSPSWSHVVQCEEGVDHKIRDCEFEEVRN